VLTSTQEQYRVEQKAYSYITGIRTSLLLWLSRASRCPFSARRPQPLGHGFRWAKWYDKGL